MKQILTLSILLVVTITVSQAQKKDTVHITSSQLATTFLREGTHRYLMYIKMNKDAPRTQTQFWTRTIKRTNEQGIPVIQIDQEWQDKDSVMHVVRSVSDAKTMQPIYHNTWWKWPASRSGNTFTTIRTVVDFKQNLVVHNEQQLSDADTGRQVKKIWEGYKSAAGKYFLNWHLDLETFPLLPFRNGVTFLIPFYDPGTASTYQKVYYTVTGSGMLEGYNDQKIDCWLLTHEEQGNKEIYWISKKTKEVLKLEQVMNGTVYRYKIKLGFSS